MSNLKKAHKRGMITGLKDVTFDKNKQVATHHPIKLLHMDLFGPTTYKSIGGNLYCLVIVDDFSRYTWVMFIRVKLRNSSRHLQEELKGSTTPQLWKSGVTTAPSSRIWRLKNGAMKRASSMSSLPPTRLNKMEWWRERAMLDDYVTSEKFWAEAINTACHASSRVYPHRLLKKTPYELITGRKPNIYPTFESLVANASFIRRKGSVSLRVDVMKVSFLVMHQTPKHIEYSIKPPG